MNKYKKLSKPKEKKKINFKVFSFSKNFNKKSNNMRK